jgi:GDP-L-fucose synthase
MKLGSKIYIAGHLGLVGSAIKRKLESLGYNNLVCLSRNELDLTRQSDVEAFFETERPNYVFLAAAKVGGILANDTCPADFIKDNLLIQTNIINSSRLYGVGKILFLGSSCIYPKDAPQPIKEDYLLSGKLETTNEPYAVAKIAGIRMCQSFNKQYGTNYISIMPTNLYGPGDNFDLESSHVLPALIRKIHEAKVKRKPNFQVWGTGKARREFLYVDDLAEASIFLMNKYNQSKIINVGTGGDINIKTLVNMLKDIIEFDGEIIYDTSKPDGTLRKLLDVSRINSLGWKAKTGLTDGIKKTYKWYLQNFS